MVVAALLGSLAYPPLSQPAMIIVSLCIFFIAAFRVSARGALALGAIYGVTISSLSLSWLGAESIQYWAISCALFSLIYGIFAVLSAFLSHIPGWPLWVAAAYALVDLVVGTIDISAITVLRVVYTQSETILFNATSIAGPATVAFLVALISGLVASLVIHFLFMDKHIYWLLILGATSMLPIVAVALIPNSVAPGKTDFSVLAVQPSVASGLRTGTALGSMPGEIGASLQWLRSYASEYPYGGKVPPDIAVLPSRTTTMSALANPLVSKAIRSTSERLEAPILVGYSTGITPDLGESRYGLWNETGEISNFALLPHGQGPLEDKYTPVPEPVGKELLNILKVGGSNIGVVETAQVFESADEMPNLNQTQFIIVLRPDIDGEVGLIAARNSLVSSRVFGSAIQRPTLTLGERGPSGFSDSQGHLTTWASRDRAGYIFDIHSLQTPGGLPTRRDSLFFLVFLILPIAATISALYLGRHPTLARKFPKRVIEHSR